MQVDILTKDTLTENSNYCKITEEMSHKENQLFSNRGRPQLQVEEQNICDMLNPDSRTFQQHCNQVQDQMASFVSSLKAAQDSIVNLDDGRKTKPLVQGK